MRNRKEKEQLVKEMNEKFKKASMVVLTDFHGMTVAESTQLRRKLREVGGEYKVVKNTLMRYAYPGTPVEQIKDAFVGPTGIVFAYDDIVSVAKVLKEFLSSEDFHLKFKSAVIEGKPADETAIKRLAELPSREELLSQLVFTMKYPVNGIVWSLQNLLTRLVTVLENVKTQKENA